MKKIVTNRTKWTPKHETFIQPVSNVYDLINQNTGDNLTDYNATTQGLMDIVREGINTNTRIRTIGGEWSFSNVAGTNGILLNTKALNIKFEMSSYSVLPSSSIKPENLFFFQCGNSILEISRVLKQRGKSFKTTGASNGQTIAGALATGTHGAAIDVGSFSNFVVGFHLILGPNKHIYLERKSNRIVKKDFTDKLNTTIVSDDALFNAVLVSFGSIGIIHGVMIEVTDLFLYDSYRVKLPLDNSLLNLMTSLDFSKPNKLPLGSKRPYHFQIVLNPYDIASGVFCTVMYKKKYTSNHKPLNNFPDGMVPGDEVGRLLSFITSTIPSSIPTLLKTVIKTQYKVIDKPTVGTHDEIFSNTDLQGKLLSCAISVDIKDAKDFLNLYLQFNNSKGPFPGLLACRFVKGTEATLGFTRFANSCVFELDGLFNDNTRKFCKDFSDLLMSKNIAFTFHWGKELPIDKAKFEYMYPKNKIEEWINARNLLLENAATMNVFENQLMENLGLDKINIIV